MATGDCTDLRARPAYCLRNAANQLLLPCVRIPGPVDVTSGRCMASTIAVLKLRQYATKHYIIRVHSVTWHRVQTPSHHHHAAEYTATAFVFFIFVFTYHACLAPHTICILPIPCRGRIPGGICIPFHFFTTVVAYIYYTSRLRSFTVSNLQLSQRFNRILRIWHAHHNNRHHVCTWRTADGAHVHPASSFTAKCKCV
jgi:hypothetical protein